MFNDENLKKGAVPAIICVFCLICIICIIGALVTGLVVAFVDLGSVEVESVPAETALTEIYEKEEINNVLPIETEEAIGCEHNWIISEKYITLVRTVNLECVASEGLERVYLTRHREDLDNNGGDIYIAYDENLQDITLQDWDGVFEIEYFPAGVGMGTPRLEEYEFTLYACENENCNELKHVPRDKTMLYRFYIPEGTYLITH